MFHRFICRCFVMLFGVPLSHLGYDDGMSSPGGKISFAYTQIKHSFKLFFQAIMSWGSESTDSSHRCCNENTHKISSPGHSQWYGSKCCSAEFEESYSEHATLFWLIFPVSLQEHWF